MDEEVFAFTHLDLTLNSKNTAEVFWNDTAFTDVTLVTCDDRQINAHKVILSNFSALFRNIIDRNHHQKPLIYLKDITHSTLIVLLKYIYIGRCEVKAGDLEAFLATAKDLKIEGINEGLSQEEPTSEKKFHRTFQNDNEIPKIEDNTPYIKDSAEIYEIVKLEDGLKNQSQAKESLPVSESILFESKEVYKVGVSCPKCEKQFKYIGILTKHMKEVHLKTSKKKKKLKRKEGIYVCSLCESKFTTQTLLSLHIEAHHIVRTCRVEWCQKECDSRKLEVKHFAKKHSRDQGKPRLKENEAPSPCNECGKELATKRGMRKHIITHEALATVIGAGLLLGNLDRKEEKK